jgi:hypothetical protein
MGGERWNEGLEGMLEVTCKLRREVLWQCRKLRGVDQDALGDGVLEERRAAGKAHNGLRPTRQKRTVSALGLVQRPGL